MVKTSLSAVGVANNDIERTPSKGQKAFNTLVGKIEKRRSTLAEWQTFDSDFRRKYNTELMPLRQSFDALRIQLVHQLDQAHDTKGLTNTERQTIEDLIIHLAGDLLASIDEPAIAEVFARYTASDAEGEAAVADEMRVAMQDMFGVDLPDETDFTSPDDVIQKVQEQLDERERLHQEAREEYQRNRKKTPKREAAEERARAEQEEVHLSIREVYRKLASALHPDREADPVERERKAVLMQRVNQAYASKSLLDLLEIQLELEHIDQSSLDNVSEDRLKRWNTILKGQLRGLDQELVEVESGFRAMCGIRPGVPVSPKSVKRTMTMDITHLREGVRAFEQDMRVFDDGKRLKAWLKGMKRVLAAQRYDDSPY